jgi:hypothetical protein
MRSAIEDCRVLARPYLPPLLFLCPDSTFSPHTCPGWVTQPLQIFYFERKWRARPVLAASLERERYEKQYLLAAKIITSVVVEKTRKEVIVDRSLLQQLG